MSSILCAHQQYGFMTSQVSINVRFLLWSRKIGRTDWEAWLVTETILPLDMCRRLVRGTLTDGEMSNDQMESLAEALGLNQKTLRLADLPHDRGNVLLENLRFLFSTLGRGGKKALAAKMDIDPTTVSRWLS